MIDLLLSNVLMARPIWNLRLAVSAAEFCRSYLADLRIRNAELCPPALVDGQDLFALQVPQGPAFRDLLTTIRNEQLDERLTTREAALSRLRELLTMSVEP